MINYRLGLHIGTHSIGWCMMHITEKGIPVDIIDSGVRIFSNGREPTNKRGIPGDPLAVERTMVRSMRRGNDRYAMRKRNVLKQLRKFDLLPKEIDFSQKKIMELNKLELRSLAVERKLEPYEISLAIYHLQKARGFKSNRKDNQRADKNELSGMKLGINNLSKVLNSQYTLGQYLYKRQKDRGLSSKFRPNTENKNMPLYEFYASREMVENEFNAIWEYQKQYYPTLLTEEAYKSIHKAIFYQRPLKPQPKGKCTIIAYEDRADWAFPSSQHFRIIKEINNLKFDQPESVRGSRLDSAQRRKLYNELCSQYSLTFNQIKRLLGLSTTHEFNLDTNGRDRLKGDETAKLMREEDRFGVAWDQLNLQEQDNIIGKLIQDDTRHPEYMDDETLTHWLINKYKLSPIQAQKVINTSFPSSCCNFGKTIITSILPKMVNEGMFESEAIKECGYNPHKEDVYKIYEQLPYYGKILEKHVVKNEKSSDPNVKEYGRISNPTVHIVFNQLRVLLNRLKENHGTWPQEIVIEMERNLKKGTKEITKIIREIQNNSKKQDNWRNEIERIKGQTATKEDYLRMKLWEELAENPTHRKCIYTGRTINISMLFSDEVQIDYILPYSKTLDNSPANLVLMTTQGALIKNNQIPYTAFSDQSEEYGYQKILERSRSLPKSKQWRFRPDAMEIFNSKAALIEDNSNIDNDNKKLIETGLDAFAVRPLRDTHYIPKLCKKYLGTICLKGERGVIATPGTLTSLLRGSWGLNDMLQDQKYDYRRYIVNALVLSLTNYFIVRKIADAARLEEIKGIKITRTIGNEKPFALFDWEKLQTSLNKNIVSFKPDHGKGGKLHDDTYYGYIGITAKNMAQIVVRKPLNSIKTIDDVEYIREAGIRNKIKNFIGTRTDIQEALQEFSTNKELNPFGIKYIRMVDEKPRNILVDIKKDLYGKPIKVAQGGSNHHAEIYCPKNGDKAGNWQMEIIKTFDVNQKQFIPQWKIDYPDAELIMILHINDMVTYEENSQIEIRRVKKISSAKSVFLTPHNVTKEKEEETMWGASAKQLQLKNARRVLVKIDGSVYDPFNIITLNKSSAVIATKKVI